MINSNTILCCVIGNPVKHSFSPQIHNSAYQKMGLNFCYLAFEVNDLATAISGLRSLHVRGISVTIPHKVKVMDYLDFIDPLARKIGAVNTIVNDQGVLKGHNTDAFGAKTALMRVTVLKGKNALVLGSGGAARSICAVLNQQGANIQLYSRNTKVANAFIRDFKIDRLLTVINNKDVKKADILINATPVGMQPDSGKSLVPDNMLHEKLTVFDLVYNPMETKLLQDAKKANCRIVYGADMLLYQAVMQFKLYTLKNAPIEVMKKSLLQALS